MVGEPQALKYILSCGSTALLIDSRYEDFFSRGLEPRVNHLPVSAVGMCESIRDAVEWGNAHPDEAERVVRQGQRLMQDLGMDAVYDYMLHLLTEYAALQDFTPAPPTTAQEACEGSVLCLAEEHRGGSWRRLPRRRPPPSRAPCRRCRLPTSDQSEAAIEGAKWRLHTRGVVEILNSG